MITRKNRTTLLAIVATVMLLAGCKGESPTSPTNNPTPTPPGGSVTPPSGAAVTLAVSSANPQVNSSSVITATVTQGGQPVPNGTAVEFTTDLGTFTEANAQTMIRTTTNGVATATLTSSAAGPANVTATVNNVSAKTKITFSAIPTQIPPPDLTPIISSVSPTIGKPQGGDVVTITGKNFANPKVIFDFGGGKTVPAFIQSSNSTTIQVITPGVDLGAGQQTKANIIVINNAGSPNEVTLTASTPFTFQSEVLTPKITTLSPTTGPIEGGTRVTIFGEGFQAPLQVFFGSAEAQLVSAVTFNQITVIAPAGSTTLPGGSGPLTGFVDVKIININSATNVTASAAYRYVAKVLITAVTPPGGSALGGTIVTLDGQGFNDPVTVDLAGVRASVISVVGSRIVVRSGALPSPCSGVSAAVVVTNVDNGDQYTTSSAPVPFGYTYFPVTPFVNSVTSSASPITLGSPITVTVTDPGVGPNGTGAIALTLGAVPISVSPNPVTNGTGTVTFSSAIPTTGITFPTTSCISGGLNGTQLGPLQATLGFSNTTTNCSATLLNAITIQPPGPNLCVVQPTATVTAPGGGGCTTQTSTVGTPTSAGGTITITNTSPAGASPLNITGVSIGGTNPADFSITPPTASNIAPGSSANFTVKFTPGALGARSATATFSTNDPANPTVTVCLNGTGT